MVTPPAAGPDAARVAMSQVVGALSATAVDSVNPRTAAPMGSTPVQRDPRPGPIRHAAALNSAGRDTGAVLTPSTVPSGRWKTNSPLASPEAR